jgi:beta-glucanase (GH16 family)
MRSTTFTTAVLLSALSLAQAQTFTDCNPLDKTCPADPALGTTITTDFTKGKSNDWTYADGTTMTYGPDGAEFIINKAGNAPTISFDKYIFFGKVTAEIKSSPGTGIVSSFILESDDLDEIDWEWLGSDNTQVQTNFFGKGDTTSYDRGGKSVVATPIDTWHTYTIEWTQDNVIWSIDGTNVRTLGYLDSTAHNGTRYPQTPMKVKMGNWIGCLDATDPATLGTCQWAGGQASFTPTTAYTMFVKSVTIEDHGCGSEYTYGDESGTWQSIKTTGACGGNSSSDSDSDSSSSASATSSSASDAASKTKSPGVFAESSTAASAKSTSTDSAVSTTATTLTTATNAAQTTAAGVTDSPSSITSAPAASHTPNSASKTKYGVADFAVIILGLGLGYLVM